MAYTNTKRKGTYSHIKKGKAPDLDDGVYYRSGWERDFARFLNMLTLTGVIRGWEYEPQTFSFQGLGYTIGAMNYKPDFVLQFTDDEAMLTPIQHLLEQVFDHVEPDKTIYAEVKGRILSKDRTKWRRFRKHVSDNLSVVDRSRLKFIQSNFVVPGWESRII